MKKSSAAAPPALENGTGAHDETAELKQLLAALSAFKRGDFSARLPDDWDGIAGKVADTFNDVIATNQRMARELDRISRVVGKEGRITQRASIGDVSDCWAESIGSVNALIGDLVNPTSEMARVIGAVAKGDLSKTMALDIEGRPLGGRVFAHREDGEHDGGSARRVRLGSDACGARGRHGRQARRPGEGEGRGRHLEGSHGEREPDGR
jgi:HAMP domain-containing protein